ncbi:MAG: hypothetical protein A3F43_05075 [Gammaproteobacteria bacterium RIFCSPHIGHO2_12_FULL_42_10]|nr:MAG: hypothetical protein A3F43_05075 [Gammaproteobacteria bacterium RIFCSPHIGHO2_12_FULL_42_10]
MKDSLMMLIIVSNSTTCRLYRYHHNEHPPLVRLQEINHPENKLKISELVSDKSGHYDASPNNQGSYSPPHDPKEVAIDNFTQEIAHILHQAHTHNGYKKCVLIAPPRIAGLLAQHFNKPDQAFVTQTIKKDIVHLPDHELLDFIEAHLKN